MIALLLALQAQLPTVGDTIWLVRRIAVPAGSAVRAAPWTLEGEVELLGRPVVILTGDSAEIRYPAVAWSPGDHSLEVPGPVLLAADGRADSLPPARLTFAVRSVLPSGADAARLAVQPRASIVRRPDRTPVPLLVLLGVAALIIVPIQLRWRRRGAAPHAAPAAPADIGVNPRIIERWLAAAELRAALGAAAERLRGAAERARGKAGWQETEAEGLLGVVDRLRFGPLEREEAEDICRRAIALALQLEGGGR